MTMLNKLICDDYGTPLALGDVLEDQHEDQHGELGSLLWRFHYVEDCGYGPQIRNFVAHNVHTAYGKLKRIGAWNDPHVIKRLIAAGVHKTAKEIEDNVWELMRNDDDN